MFVAVVVYARVVVFAQTFLQRCRLLPFNCLRPGYMTQHVREVLEFVLAA